MKRCSFCEWIPILPWPVWPLAEQCSLGQNVVVGSMLVLQVALGNLPRGVCLDPRLHYKCTSPRLPAELPIEECFRNFRFFFFFSFSFFWFRFRIRIRCNSYCTMQGATGFTCTACVGCPCRNHGRGR